MLQSEFASIIDKPHFVDKTFMIRLIFDLLLRKPNTSKSSSSVTVFGSQLAKNDPILLTAPRRFGKTTNIDMLKCFFGGFVAKEIFRDLKIGKYEEAMKCWNKFHVVYVTFGHCCGVIESYRDGVNACRSILHKTFTNFNYIKSTLSKTNIVAFNDWVDEKKYLNKEDLEIGTGLEFLVRCVVEYSNNEKPILLLIDEFDRICSKAMFNTKNADTLNKIITFYCDMVGEAIKHESSCLTVLTGVAAITCKGLSGTNNIDYINSLNMKHLWKFTG